MLSLLALAGALEIVASSFNAGNKVSEGILDNLAENHEGADLLLLGMQEFQEYPGESLRLGQELWATDREELAAKLTRSVRLAAAKCARDARAEGVNLESSLPLSEQPFAATKLAANCAHNIQSTVELFQDAFPNAKWAGENSETQADLDCTGCSTRFWPRWARPAIGWRKRLREGDFTVLDALDKLKVGPESFEAKYHEEASAFQFGCLLARGGTHFYTDMRVFVRPGSPYRYELQGHETVSKIRGNECGKVIQYIVLKATKPDTRGVGTPLKVGDKVKKPGERGVGYVESTAPDGTGTVDFPTKRLTDVALSELTLAPNERKICLMNTHLSFASTSMYRARDIHTTLKSLLATAKCDTTVFVGDFNTRLHCEPHESKVHYSLLPPFARSPDPASLIDAVCNGDNCSLRDSEVGVVERWDELRQFLTQNRVRCYELLENALDKDTRRLSNQRIYRDEWSVECKCGLDTGRPSTTPGQLFESHVTTMPGSLFQHSGPAERLTASEADYRGAFGDWAPCGGAAEELCSRVQSTCEVPSTQKSKSKWFKSLFTQSSTKYQHYCKYHASPATPRAPTSRAHRTPFAATARADGETGDAIVVSGGGSRTPERSAHTATELPSLELPNLGSAGSRSAALIEADAREHLVRRVTDQSQVKMEDFTFEDFENPGIQNMGFEEPFGRAPNFKPTYKIAKSKHDKTGMPCIGGTCYQNKDGKAKHNPGYTDRVIVQSSDRVEMTARDYDVLPLHADFGSDHLPVQAALSIEFL